jgi:hypothetical protein
MTTMKLRMMLLLTASLLLAGCEESLLQPATPTGPAGLTKAEIEAKVKPIIEPFRQLVAAGKTESGITPEVREQVLAGLRDANIQYGSTPEGQESLRELGHEISNIAKQARDQEQWRLVEAAVDAFEILSMESILMSRLDQRAKTILAQPKVEVKGFMEDKASNAIYIFLRVTDRATGKVKSMNVREGDVFNDLRVVEIVGANKAVRFEYLKIPGLIFEVKGPEY